MTVLEAIKQICAERERKNIVSVCAPLVDIKNLTKLSAEEIHCQIDRLIFEKKIERRLAVSGFTFYLTENGVNH